MTRYAWVLRIVVLTLLLVFGLVLQTSVFSEIAFLGVRPHVILVIVVSIGFLRGPTHGFGAGFLGGLLADVFTGHLIGLGAGALALTGGLVGYAGQRLVRDRLLPVVLLTAGATLLHEMAYAGGAWLFGIHFPFVEGFVRIIAPLLLYNAIFSLLLHNRLASLNGWIERTALVPHRSIPID